MRARIISRLQLTHRRRPLTVLNRSMRARIISRLQRFTPVRSCSALPALNEGQDYIPATTCIAAEELDRSWIALNEGQDYIPATTPLTKPLGQAKQRRSMRARIISRLQLEALEELENPSKALNKGQDYIPATTTPPRTEHPGPLSAQ